MPIKIAVTVFSGYVLLGEAVLSSDLLIEYLLGNIYHLWDGGGRYLRKILDESWGGGDKFGRYSMGG